jgi:hypothetical protein
MTDHQHTFTDHGPTSTGGTWERCPCGVIRATENGRTVEVQQPPDPDYPKGSK